MKRIVLIMLTLAVATALHGQDTLRRTTLDEVSVTAQSAPATLRSQAPTQVVTVEKIEQSGAMQLSDVVRQMAGVTLKDYGGVGGMKTVSARGLGSQFSTLTIDGVAVTDAQNGQVDLGRYMLGNTAYISLSQGQQDGLLQSARAFAAGSVLNMETRAPSFFLAERTNLKMGVDAGSFGLVSPSLSWEQKLSERLSMSLWANYLRSTGDYPYTLYYTPDHQGQSSRERRFNSQVRTATADLNFFYQLRRNQTLVTKMHLMSGFHALPGPVQLYNPKGSEFTRETLAFIQTKWRGRQGNWQWQAIGKAQYNYDFYEDTAFNNPSHYLSNNYSQMEGYLSGSAVWSPIKPLSLGLATDLALNHLASNLNVYNDVWRRSLLAVASACFGWSRIELNANLLATLIGEEAATRDVPGSERPASYSRLSPYAGLTLQPIEGLPLRLRYFFKETYRVPNFSEMYFFTIPRNLRPERAEQHNVGLTWNYYQGGDSLTTTCLLTLDGYLNHITDKLIAIPTQNMFLWSMVNLGLVRIAGLDLKAETSWQWPRASLILSVTYTYQHATDRTNPADRTYANQIPYTPRHSGNLQLYAELPWINVGYSVMVVGERYSMRQNSADYRLPPYADHGLTVDRSFDLPGATLRLKAQALNLLDVQYEVVRSYPMMGRNYRVGAIVEF